VRTAQSFGLTADAMFGPLPELSPQAQLAAYCWRFCEGWAPERWPVFGALHDVHDWHALAELMAAIRDAHDKAAT
jgi:hypothetical protein